MTPIATEYPVTGLQLVAYLRSKGLDARPRLFGAMAVVHVTAAVGAIVRPTWRGVIVVGTIPTWRGVLQALYQFPWLWSSWRGLEAHIADQIRADLGK